MTWQVNIILVIHPRKDDDRMPLGISSIFGTAKATQEADMVIILQVRYIIFSHVLCLICCRNWIKYILR